MKIQTLVVCALFVALSVTANAAEGRTDVYTVIGDVQSHGEIPYSGRLVQILEPPKTDIRPQWIFVFQADNGTIFLLDWETLQRNTLNRINALDAANKARKQK